MPKPTLQSLEDVEARKLALKQAKSEKIAAIRKDHAKEIAELNVTERRIKTDQQKDLRKRENHAKILVGIAIIHQCQASESSATKFRALLEEFYSDSPERLQNALSGLSIIVKKPSSDADRADLFDKRVVVPSPAAEPGLSQVKASQEPLRALGKEKVGAGSKQSE